MTRPSHDPNPGLPSRRQFERWLVDAIQPLVEAAESELYFLQRGNASWRFHKRALDHLAPATERVLLRARPNLDQLVRFLPAVAEAISRHDELVVALRSRCETAHDGLRRDEAFRRAVDDACDRYGRDASGRSDWLGAFPEDQRFDVAAEYVVNGIAPDAVPHGYTTREFWAAQGGALLEFRRKAPHRQSFAAMEATLGELKEWTRRMLDRLVENRDELADRLKAPAAIP